MAKSVEQRFWEKVDVRSSGECWFWLAYKDKKGYGQFSINRRIFRAPRVALWLKNGEWPEVACHTCDNPSCVNPAHLYAGTYQTNMDDCIERRRHKAAKGSASGRSKLTDAKVVEIRRRCAAGESQRSVSRRFGVCERTVTAIVKRETWRHVSDGQRVSDVPGVVFRV